MDIKNGEKTYKIMSGIGTGNIILGSIVIVMSVVCGIITIVNGARILINRKNILY